MISFIPKQEWQNPEITISDMVDILYTTYYLKETYFLKKIFETGAKVQS